MTDFENDLKHALRREEPPETFAEQVQTRLAEGRAAQAGAEKARKFRGESILGFFNRPLIRWATAAALAAVLVSGSLEYRKAQRERAEGEAAKKQLMLAVRIAGAKLNHAKFMVTHPEGNDEKE